MTQLNNYYLTIGVRICVVTVGGKVRAGLGMLGLIAGKPDHEESIQEFATRHLGQFVQFPC